MRDHHEKAAAPVEETAARHESEPHSSGDVNRLPNLEKLNVRQTQNGPFCWQSKAARRKIRDALDGANTVASGLGVYDALTEIASDHQAESFQTTHAHIAKISGLASTCVKQRLRDLKELGLIAIETPNLKMPSTYSILPLVAEKPSIDVERPALDIGGQSPSTSTLEESLEESPEESVKKPASAKPSRSRKLSDEEFLSALRVNRAFQGIDIDRELGRLDAWLLARPGLQKTQRRIAAWLNRVEKPIPIGGKNAATTKEQHDRGF